MAADFLEASGTLPGRSRGRRAFDGGVFDAGVHAAAARASPPARTARRLATIPVLPRGALPVALHALRWRSLLSHVRPPVVAIEERPFRNEAKCPVPCPVPTLLALTAMTAKAW